MGSTDILRWVSLVSLLIGLALMIRQKGDGSASLREEDVVWSKVTRILHADPDLARSGNSGQISSHKNQFSIG
jgi:hypothetical protein